MAFLSRDAFLTDDGMLPRGKHITKYEKDGGFRDDLSVYQTHGINLWLAAGAPETVMVLLMVQLLFTCGLLVGYCTRLSLAAILAFMNSWFLRLANKTGGGLEIINIMLLWGFLLPLGGTYSIDALCVTQKGTTKGDDSNAPSALSVMTKSLCSLFDCILSIGIPLYFAVMYYACGAVKDTVHWKDGNAVIMTLNRGNEANEPFVSVMGRFPLLCWALTHTTVYLEKYGGFFLLVPFTMVRLASLALLIPFHIGMHLALDIGMFQPTMISGLLLLMPTCGCDFLEARLQGSWSRLLVLFAGSREKGITTLQNGQQVAKAVCVFLIAALCVAMALGVTLLTTNDLCDYLSRRTGGRHTCWQYGTDRTNMPVNRWLAFMGPPQYHTPFATIQTRRRYWHIVGIVEKNMTTDDGDSCISEAGEKAVVLFTDENGSQLNFDEHVLWSPNREMHLNMKWHKYFARPYHSELANHLCKKWNHRSSYPKLKSVAMLEVWQHMLFPNGSLVLSPRRYKYESYFGCSDIGQSGELSNDAPLISNAMAKHKIERFQDLVVQNEGDYPVHVFWVHHITGEEIHKGTIQKHGAWDQLAQIGHTFKFYWDIPGATKKKHLPAGQYTIGNRDGKFTISQLNAEFEVNNNARYPLKLNWVHHKTGREIQLGSIQGQSKWTGTVGLGHAFRFYWDLPDAIKGLDNVNVLLAREHTIQGLNEKIVINDNLFEAKGV